MVKPFVVYDVRKSDFGDVRIYDYLNPSTLDFINRDIYSSFRRMQSTGNTSNRGVLVTLRSLEQLTPELLDKLDDRIEYVQVQDFTRYIRQSVTSAKITFFENSQVLERKDDYIDSSCIYSREELKEILGKIQEIDRGLDGMDDFTKLVVIYDRIKRSISYDYETGEKKSGDTRSLRGLISGKTVCAGYVEILSNILKRNGIDCRYVDGNNHAWCEVKIDNNMYMLDLTNDAQLFHEGVEGIDSMQNFCMDPGEFVKKHADARNLTDVGEYSAFDRDEVKMALQISELDVSYGKNDTWRLERSDGTKFQLTQVGTIKTKDPDSGKDISVYRYIYWDVKNGGPDKDSLKIVYSTDNLKKMYSYRDIYTHYEPNLQIAEVCEKRAQLVIDDVFSLENMESAFSMNSSFLGGLHRGENKGELMVRNSEEIAKKPMFSFSENACYIGNCIIERAGSNKVLNRFYVYTIGKKGIERLQIFSEQNLLDLPETALSELVSPQSLSEISKKYGGYVGSVDRDGNRSYDEGVKEKFQNRVGVQRR